MRTMASYRRKASSSFSIKSKWLRQAEEQNDVISEHNSWESSDEERDDESRRIMSNITSSSVDAKQEPSMIQQLSERPEISLVSEHLKYLSNAPLEDSHSDLVLLEKSKQRYESAQASTRYMSRRGMQDEQRERPPSSTGEKRRKKSQKPKVKRVVHPKGWGVRQSSWKSCDFGNLMTIMEKAWKTNQDKSVSHYSGIEGPSNTSFNNDSPDAVKRELDYEAFNLSLKKADKENAVPDQESPLGDYFDKSRAHKHSASRSSCSSKTRCKSSLPQPQLKPKRPSLVDMDCSDIKSGDLSRRQSPRQIKSRSVTPSISRKSKTKPWEDQVLEALTENPPQFFKSGITAHKPRRVLGNRCSSSLNLRPSSSLLKCNNTFSQPRLCGLNTPCGEDQVSLVFSDEGQRNKTGKQNKVSYIVSPPQELFPVFNDSTASTNRSFMNSAFDIKPETPINCRQAKTASKPAKKLTKLKKYANVESKVKKMIKHNPAPSVPKSVVKVLLPINTETQKRVRGGAFMRKGSTPNIRSNRPILSERNNMLRETFDNTPPKKKTKFERRPQHNRSNSNQMSVPRLMLNPVQEYQPILMSEEDVEKFSTKRRASLGLETGKSGQVTGIPSDIYEDQQLDTSFLRDDGGITATVSTVSGGTVNLLDLSSELKRLDLQYEEITRSLNQSVEDTQTSFISQVSTSSTGQKGVSSLSGGKKVKYHHHINLRGGGTALAYNSREEVVSSAKLLPSNLYLKKAKLGNIKEEENSTMLDESKAPL